MSVQPRVRPTWYAAHLFCEGPQQEDAEEAMQRLLHLLDPDNCPALTHLTLQLSNFCATLEHFEGLVSWLCSCKLVASEEQQPDDDDVSELPRIGVLQQLKVKAIFDRHDISLKW